MYKYNVQYVGKGVSCIAARGVVVFTVFYVYLYTEPGNLRLFVVYIYIHTLHIMLCIYVYDVFTVFYVYIYTEHNM